ncbi:VOC family protein [Lentzea cavernae]|nr:bleomycin resistance protein [Lentzea cavernae]
MNDMQAPEPEGRNTVNGFVITDHAADLIEFLQHVFDAVEDPEARAPDYAAGDGSLIHAEVRIGNSLLMVADRKADWPFTPAFTQVYVSDPVAVLTRASERGATVITDVSPFYGGYDIARFRDPWQNLWWLFAPAKAGHLAENWDEGDGDWENAEPNPVYTTLVEAMRTLTDPRGADLGLHLPKI